MNVATIEKRARSQAINKTISLVEVALGMEFPSDPTPTVSREMMIEVLVAEFRGATAKIAMLERTVADLRVAVAAKQEYFIGWGSPVILKRAKKSPVWVKLVVDGIARDADGRITMTPEFEMTVDEVAKHLRNGRLVDWGGEGLRDEQIRRAILIFDKEYSKRNPRFRRPRWNVQPPTKWEVFYVLGMDDIEDPHTRGRVSKAMKAGKRIIDITGNAPVDLTGAYRWVMGKIESGELRLAED